MKVFASTLLFLFLGVQAVSAQVSQDADKKQESPSSTQAAPEEKKDDSHLKSRDTHLVLVGKGVQLPLVFPFSCTALRSCAR